MNFEKGSIFIEQAITEVKGKDVVVKSTKNERHRHISVPEQIMNRIKKLTIFGNKKNSKPGHNGNGKPFIFIWK
jgi:hypothetical protein